VDTAQDGEVIGFYGRSTENVIFDEAKSLTITQCTTAQLTAAIAALAVVDIRPPSPSKITMISLDTVGGTIGWRVETDSQFGTFVVGNRNSVSYNSVRTSAVGIRIDGDFNDLRGGEVSDEMVQAPGYGHAPRYPDVWKKVPSLWKRTT
jgi:hypothetical protein